MGGYEGHPTGDNYDESEPGQPGHHETPQTPNKCLCCGVEYYLYEPLCICAQGGNYWMQDELRRVACYFHMQEKVNADLFGALGGNFTVPHGKPLYKPARTGQTIPIVRKHN